MRSLRRNSTVSFSSWIGDSRMPGNVRLLQTGIHRLHRVTDIRSTLSKSSTDLDLMAFDLKGWYPCQQPCNRGVAIFAVPRPPRS